MSSWFLRQMANGSVIICFLLLVTLPLPLFQLDPSKATAQTPNSVVKARVAIYAVQRLDNYSYTACIHLFEWMNACVGLITSTEIQRGALQSVDLLVLPAFGPSSYERELTPLGKERIRQFLAAGGSLFAVCRGTEFVVTSLGIIDAHLTLIDSMGVQCHDTHHGTLALKEMLVNKASTGPDLSEEPESYMVFCTGAAYFEVHGGTEIIPILAYADSGLPGVIVFQYGQGTVLLSSPHPEFEEGNDRDGLSQNDIAHWPTYQNLNDSDSEWNLLYKVSCWLIEASPGISPQHYLRLLGLIVGGLLGVLVITITIKIRKGRK